MSANNLKFMCLALIICAGAVVIAQTPSTSPSVMLSFTLLVTDEVPQYAAPSTWTLAHTPIANTLECWSGGVYQTRTAEPNHPEFQPDYSISGNVIASPNWSVSSSDGSVAVHRCRYTWVPTS